MHKKAVIGLVALLICQIAYTQIVYPYASQQFSIHIENKDSYMSYMDVKPPTVMVKQYYFSMEKTSVAITGKI